MNRAVRFARALALLGTGATAACSSRAQEESESDATTTPSDAHVLQWPDTHVDDAAPHVDDVAPRDSTPPDTDLADADAPATGRCFTVDDGEMSCAAGLMCTFAGRTLDCVDPGPPPAQGATVTAQPCGSILCSLPGTCFCANDKTSFCVCDYAAGPLSPPDLPRHPRGSTNVAHPCTATPPV